jgi:hypothetical protein
MKRNELVGLVVTAVGAFAGCGDNSDFCGPGTTAMDGVCVPSTVAPTCTDGTILNAGTNTCDIDPASCQGGTVLINNKCQDPTAGLTIDLEEGPEPNGFSIGTESSSVTAGVIMLKPIGGPGFIIHGHITPFQDTDADGQPDPDFDTYEIDVTAPTLLHITADGVGGLAASFIVQAQPGGPLDDGSGVPLYRRFGLNLTGDTSKRQIYLPAAGKYFVALEDVRSVFLDANSPNPGGFGGAAGGPNAEYYVTVDQLAIPTATALPITAGVGTTTGTIDVDSTVQFFTAPMGVGFNDIFEDVPQTETAASVMVANNAVLTRLANEGTDAGGNATTADTLLAGVNTTDTTLIVVDSAFNTGPAAAPFTLTVTQGNASKLPTDGTTVSQVAISNAPVPLTDFNVFFFETTDVNQVVGMGLSWQKPVDFTLVDSNLNIISLFTWDPGFALFGIPPGPIGNTTSAYPGLLRLANAGRYYLLVDDPTATVGTDSIVAKSTVQILTPPTIVEGTALAAQPVQNVYNSAPFAYSRGTTDPWQEFGVTGANTGNVEVSFFDPTTTFGRLDNCDIDTGGGPTPTPGDVLPLVSDGTTFSHLYTAASTTVGRIVVDDPTDYFVKVNQVATTGAQTVSFNFAVKANVHDLSTVMTSNNDSITAVTSPSAFYFIKAAVGSRVGITVHPDATTATALIDGKIQGLRNDEGAAGLPANTGGATQNDVTTFISIGSGWAAFEVQSQIPLVGTQHFDVTATVSAAETYTIGTPVTGVTLADACVGGTTLTLNAAGGFSADDEGFSDPVNAPAGFAFFGAPASQFVVSSNGFLTFDTAFASESFINSALPNLADPNGLIAPYWDDIEGVVVCVKNAGTKTTVQWTGDLFFDKSLVQMQAILNGANSTIQFVYGTAAFMENTGDAAAIGLEDQSGTAASQVGFDMTGAVAPSTSILFTPN